MEFFIKYIVPIGNFKLQSSIEFEFEHIKFIRGIIEKDTDYNYRIMLFLNKQCNYAEVEMEAIQVVDSVLNKIAYYCYGSSVGNCVMEETNLIECTKNADIDGSVEVRRPPQEEEDLRNSLNKINENSDQYYKMFRSATNATDVVSKYMFLYQMLLHIKGPTQKPVDNFICSILNENVAQFKKWQPGRKEETKLTYLRNRVGHKIEGKTIEDTRREMSSEIYNLTKVVKKAIESI